MMNHELGLMDLVFVLVSEDCQEQLDFKDMKLQMLLVSLKELTATKEVIQTLEQLLCDESSQLQEERRQVTNSSNEPSHCSIYITLNNKSSLFVLKFYGNFSKVVGKS